MTRRPPVSRSSSSNAPFSARAGLALLAAMSLAFAAAPPTPTPSSAPLENTRWVLVTVGDETAGPPEAFLLLRPSQGRRKLGGFGGCNGLKGTYDLFAGRLRVNASSLSGKPCPDTVASLETKLVEALRATANYSLEANTLKLLSADGKVVATFRR